MAGSDRVYPLTRSATGQDPGHARSSERPDDPGRPRARDLRQGRDRAFLLPRFSRAAITRAIGELTLEGIRLGARRVLLIIRRQRSPISSRAGATARGGLFMIRRPHSRYTAMIIRAAHSLLLAVVQSGTLLA